MLGLIVSAIVPENREKNVSQAREKRKNKGESKRSLKASSNSKLFLGGFLKTLR